MGNQIVAPTDKKRLLIIGASYAGMDIYNKVKQNFQVTLIDKNDFFENFIYYFKEFSRDDHFQTTVRTYEEILRKDIDTLGTKFVQGEVLKVGKDNKVLYKAANGEEKELRFDFLVIASGSTQPQPHKDKDCKTMEVRKASLRELVEKAKKAKAILVVGSGIVGIEVAGELSDVCKTSGQKLGLVTRSKTLLSTFPAKAHNIAFT